MVIILLWNLYNKPIKYDNNVENVIIYRDSVIGSLLLKNDSIYKVIKKLDNRIMESEKKTRLYKLDYKILKNKLTNEKEKIKNSKSDYSYNIINNRLDSIRSKHTKNR